MSKICCFTGHRRIAPVYRSDIFNLLKKTLRDLIENQGVTDFRAGGAIGFDSIAALYVLELKKEYPQIKLHLILPCKDQARYFSAVEKNVYIYVLTHADSVRYIREKYSSGVMYARNRALVEGADVCVAFMTRLSGGTYRTVQLARKARLNIINIAKK